MGTFAQYAVSLTLFIAIPVAIQWAVSKVTSRRTLAALESEAPAPLAQTIRD
jgi:hypothetical protein